MYQVFDNNKPAELPKSGWVNSKFPFLRDAQNYAVDWLNSPVILMPNNPYDYDGYGDIIEIRIVN